jgi:hypothetical protein
MSPEKLQWPTGAGNSRIKAVVTKVTYGRDTLEGTWYLRVDIVNDSLSLITPIFPIQKQDMQLSFLQWALH